MTAKRTEIMTIRPPKESDLITKLMKLAEKENRSLNNYVVTVLQNHTKQKSK